jgi:hypothetical protein
LPQGLARSSCHLETAWKAGLGRTPAFQHRPGTAKVRPQLTLRIAVIAVLLRRRRKKPDGEARPIYTGVLHPSVISNCALGLSLYFDELLIEHPFIHPRTVNKEFSPLEHPNTYRQEFLKSVVLFMASDESRHRYVIVMVL